MLHNLDNIKVGREIFKDFIVNTVHDPIVEIKNLVKSYEGNEVLKDINMNVKKGETIVIIGPSGGGKSTLLKCIDALSPINSGEIWVDGEIIGYKKVKEKIVRLKEKEISKQRANIGMIFQLFNLFPHFTVINNIIEAPIRVKNVDKQKAYKEAKELLEAIGLGSKADEFPNQLSGGERQRVAIARAIAMKPKLMLYDEVTSALDPELVGEVLEIIKDISLVGVTSIIVTHEMSFAKQVADTLYYLSEGKIIEQGNPKEVIENPKNEKTKTFLRHVKQM